MDCMLYFLFFTVSLLFAQQETCSANDASCSADLENQDWYKEIVKERSLLDFHAPTVPIYPPLPRVSVKELELPENIEYKRRNLPFILTHAMDDWPLLSKWPIDGKKSATKSYLANKIPQTVCDFYPYNMLKSGTHPYLYRFRSGVDEVLFPPGSFRDANQHPLSCPKGCRYLHAQLTPKVWRKFEDSGDIPKKRHPHTKGDRWWMKRCFKDKQVREEYHIKTHWKIILVGSKNSGMFNHSDSLLSASWHGHIQGKKWWYVCKDSVCYESILYPGEILFYGRHWYHNTRNLVTPTMTITGTIVLANNFEKMTEKFMDECAYGTLSFDFSAALCDSLDKCYPVWYKGFTGKDPPPGRFKSWRTFASKSHINKKEEVKAWHNNYDGRNWIGG